MHQLHIVITLFGRTTRRQENISLGMIYMMYEGYVILQQIDEDDGDVVILKLESSEGETEENSYVDVVDEETLTAVFELFKEKYKDVYKFS